MIEQLADGVVEGLGQYSTPTIANAIETFGVRPRTEGFTDHTIVCRFPERGRVAGYAVTAKIVASTPPLDELAHRTIWEAFGAVPKPWIVVIEDLDAPRSVGSYWGEVNASVYGALGAVAVVTNGGVRDLAEVRPTGFQFFSASVLVSHAYVHVVEVMTSVIVGGLRVEPGDLLHGDEHGVISVPREIAARVPEAAAAVEARERPLIEYAQSEGATLERLAQMYGKVD